MRIILKTKFRLIVLSLLALFISSFSAAQCKDIDAKQSADKLAEKYASGKVFKKAVVLKVHLPSKRKEIASYVYVKSSDLYYTIYSLVNSKCVVQIIKRTNGKH